MRREFTKKDLKSGMLVQIRDGRYLKVITDNPIHKGTITISMTGNNVMSEGSVGNNLKNNSGASYDIIRVYIPKTAKDIFNFSTEGHKLIWEEPKKIEEMSLAAVCRELGREIKIVK